MDEVKRHFQSIDLILSPNLALTLNVLLLYEMYDRKVAIGLQEPLRSKEFQSTEES